MKSNLMAHWCMRILCVTFTLLCFARHAQAGELLYTPVNPAFGGNPNNGQVLLNSAQAQNRTKENLPVTASSSQSELKQFNDMLERSVLSRLASAATAGVMGLNGQLMPGTVQTQSFEIIITDMNNGKLRITTTDKITHESTTFEVGK
jgi:curli production assembly/transport component CsgF